MLHAVEPLPATLKSALLIDAVMGGDIVFEPSARAFEQGVWPWVEYACADRLLVGSTTHRMVDDRPTSVLVVPAPKGRGQRAAPLVAAAARP